MVFSFDEYELDAEALELRRGGKPVCADTLPLRLLACLVRHAGRLVTKDELVDDVWHGCAITDNAITVSVARLRKLLGHKRGSREIVVTTYGRGYRFMPRVVARDTFSEPAGLSVGRARPPAGPLLVGRELTLEQLRRALGRARAQRGGCCVVMGEPGIGKTYLVEAFERELAGSDTHVAWGFCREAGDTPPLWPWVRVLRQVVAVCGMPSLEQHLGVAALEIEALLRPPGDPWSAPQDGVAGPDPQSASRHRAVEAILRALKLVAEQQPWVLIIDDLHRADGASLELLSHLLDEIAHMRVLVLAMLRHTPGQLRQRAQTHLPQVLGHRNCERMMLGRLGQQDVSAYVGALVDDPDDGLARAVFDKSEGNPFFMAELMRAVRDAEDAEPDRLAVPHTSLELIRQRLARLDPDVLSVLTVAAVVGRSFELPLLGAVMGRDPSALMGYLDDAIEEEVLVAAPDSTTAFAFGHELLRVVLYDGLDPQQRRGLHAQVAGILEQRMDAGQAVAPSEVAYHYHAALPHGDLRKTVRACGLAATAAAAVFATTDVIRYARHAIQALDFMERPSARMRMRFWYLIVVFIRGYASPEAQFAVGEVKRLARALDDGAMLARMAIMLNLHPGLQPLPGAEAELQEALSLLPENEPGLRAAALAALACVPPQCLSAERSYAALDKALSLARSQDSQLALWYVLIYRLYMYGGPDHEQTARQTAEELEQHAQQNPERAAVIPVDLALQRAVSALQRADSAAARAAIERGAARCRQLRHAQLLWHCERFEALSRIDTGDWTEGMALLESLHHQAEQQQIYGAQLFCAIDRVVILAELGRAPEPDDTLRHALSFEPSDPPSIWSLKTRALASCGWHDEARAMLRAIPREHLGQLPCDRDYLGSLGHLARAVVLLNAADYVEALCALLDRHAGRIAVGVACVCEGSVDQLLGMLEQSRGRYAQAAARLEAGIRINEKAGLVLRAHEAQLQLARCLVDLAEADAQQRALALLRKVQASATELGLKSVAKQAANLLDEPVLAELASRV